jgi:hypothetical protein
VAQHFCPARRETIGTSADTYVALARSPPKVVLLLAARRSICESFPAACAVLVADGTDRGYRKLNADCGVVVIIIRS